MSHSRQESGDSSSATTIRMRSFSHNRPVSILKSTRRMPTPRNRPEQELMAGYGGRHDVVDLVRGCPAEGGDVLLRYHRIAELVVFIVEFDDRARQLRAFLEPQPLRQRARRDVAHHHLERNDLHL